MFDGVLMNTLYVIYRNGSEITLYDSVRTLYIKLTNGSSFASYSVSSGYFSYVSGFWISSKKFILIISFIKIINEIF